MHCSLTIMTSILWAAGHFEAARLMRSAAWRCLTFAQCRQRVPSPPELPATRYRPQRIQLSEAAASVLHLAPHDDRGGVSGAAAALQHSMRAALIAAVARDYCDDFVFLLLAPQAPQWEASDKISAVRTRQEPR